jgi:CheY-like chemotaxis protein
MAPSPSADSGRLLVVDDNKVNRLLLGRGLEQQGHQVEFAENGQQALDRLRQERFDLVLLDIMMPELDGYQVLEQLTGSPELRDIPVIMTSANDELDSVARCIEMGAEDFLVKPPNPVLLKARIGASLEKKRLRDQQRELVRRFATAEVADELLTNGFELGGKFVDATAMFSDIRGFTSIAESQSPADHPRRAVQAAQEMVELIQLFNQGQTALGKAPIQIGIGIASGRVIAGFTGTQTRATYTCVGDTVNLAARLEAHTKVLGQPILIDQNTWQGLAGQIEAVELEPVQLRGKSATVRVFSVPLKAEAAELGSPG